MLSLDAALLHGLHSLGRGYWPVVAALLDKQSLTTITALPYATKALARGNVNYELSHRRAKSDYGTVLEFTLTDLVLRYVLFLFLPWGKSHIYVSTFQLISLPISIE